MQGCDSQLAILKDILNKISVSSGLIVNFHKLCLVPINISSERANSLAQSFGCTVGSLPFTYLGLPMGLTKPQVKDYAPLICRIERKMAATSPHLSYAGRLQLVNSVLSSLPTYYMCTLKLPITVIDIIDKHGKNCLWRGREFSRKGYNLAAWDFVRKPKAKGGLGVINLSVQNDALLLKQLDKFYKQENIQWVNLICQKYYNGTVPHLAKEKGSFWWKDILRLNVQFRGVARCTPIMEIQSVSGRILLMEGFTLIFFLILWALLKILVSLFGPSGRLHPCLTVLESPCPGKPIMSYFNCRTFLMAYTLWIRMVKTLGFTFGDSIDIPLVNTIITISETFSPI
jgi:hypothetical protein